MLLDLYWHDHVDQTVSSLVIFFEIFNHVKHFFSLRVARQLFAFIYSRKQYGIEAYELCEKK